jgi:hypothetical protein
MPNFYRHEKLEGRITRNDRDRPPMPRETEKLWPAMQRYLTKRDLDWQLAKQNGWYPSNAVDGYDRIVIPCSNSTGLPYYQARAIDNWTTIRYNSPAATRMDSVVLVWPRHRDAIRGTLVVEGPTDALAGAMCGYLGVGLMGNEPPTNVIEYIVRMVTGVGGCVLVLPDADHFEMGPYVAGSLAAYGLSARILIPAAKDLASMPRLVREKLLNGKG